MATFRESVSRSTRGRGRGILVSLHDLGLAARWCDRLVVMRDGEIAADGEPSVVLTAARLREVYGIEAHIDEDGGGLLVLPIALAPKEEGPAAHEADPRVTDP